MPTQKITAANATVPPHGPVQTDRHPDDRRYWVRGVLYTDDPAFVAYAHRRGHLVEPAPDGVPADYEAAVAAMRETEGRAGAVRPSVAIQDAANPTAQHYYA